MKAVQRTLAHEDGGRGFLWPNCSEVLNHNVKCLGAICLGWETRIKEADDGDDEEAGRVCTENQTRIRDRASLNSLA